MAYSVYVVGHFGYDRVPAMARGAFLYSLEKVPASPFTVLDSVSSGVIVPLLVCLTPGVVRHRHLTCCLKGPANVRGSPGRHVGEDVDDGVHGKGQLLPEDEVVRTMSN